MSNKFHILCGDFIYRFLEVKTDWKGVLESRR